mgnify:CR=1 FL=1
MFAWEYRASKLSIILQCFISIVALVLLIVLTLVLNMRIYTYLLLWIARLHLAIVLILMTKCVLLVFLIWILVIYTFILAWWSRLSLNLLLLTGERIFIRSKSSPEKVCRCSWTHILSWFFLRAIITCRQNIGWTLVNSSCLTRIYSLHVSIILVWWTPDIILVPLLIGILQAIWSVESPRIISIVVRYGIWRHSVVVTIISFFSFLQKPGRLIWWASQPIPWESSCWAFLAWAGFSGGTHLVLIFVDLLLKGTIVLTFEWLMLGLRVRRWNWRLLLLIRMLRQIFRIVFDEILVIANSLRCWSSCT